MHTAVCKLHYLDAENFPRLGLSLSPQHPRHHAAPQPRSLAQKSIPGHRFPRSPVYPRYRMFIANNNFPVGRFRDRRTISSIDGAGALHGLRGIRPTAPTPLASVTNPHIECSSRRYSRMVQWTIVTHHLQTLCEDESPALYHNPSREKKKFSS